MDGRDQLVRKFWDKARAEAERPDEIGFLGVLDDGTWPGTAEADGYLYDIPYRPGLVYARIIAGSSFEVCEVVQGGVARDPNQMIGFRREGVRLVGWKVVGESALAGQGANAPRQYVAEHDQPATTITYVPAVADDWATVPTTAQGALDALAAAGDVIDVTIDDRLVAILREGRRTTRLTGSGLPGRRRKRQGINLLLGWPYGARR